MNINNSSEYQVDQLNKTPYSMDAERSVIGGLLLDNDTWEHVEILLQEDDFYHKGHRIIFSKIIELAHQMIPFDVVTISDSLSNDHKLESAGGFHYVAELVKNTPTSANIIAYSNIVKDRSKLRSLLGATRNISDKAYSPENNKVDDLIDYAEQQILSVASTRDNNSASPIMINKIIPKVLERLDAISESENGITGIASGFADLDKITSGLHPSNLAIIAARPSMGKTVLGINIAENVAHKAKKPVLVFSLEMPAEDIVMRMISSLGRIEMTSLRDGNIKDHQWGQISTTMKLIEGMNMYIDDTPSISPAEMRSRSRRIYKENGGLELIVVDYLQLMKVPGYEANRTLEVSEISRSLKSLSKELNVPVIALSQLNRGVDDRADKRPMMSDLRESGAIEQDADVIMFIYRDEVYHKDNENNKGLGEIIIGKQRNGPIGIVKVQFEGRFCRFADLSPERDIPSDSY